jgi:hypothetical protein
MSVLVSLQVGLMKEKYDHRLLLKHLPSDFKQFLEHLQALEYADKPDCAMLLGLFERTMKRRGVRESDPFDWEKNPSTNSSIAGEVPATSNPAVATGGTGNVALGSRNTAHLQQTSTLPVSALPVTGASGAVAGSTDNQENQVAAVDNQENLEPDNRKDNLRITEGDPKAMPRAHRTQQFVAEATGTSDLNGTPDSPRAASGKAEMDKNCNANANCKTDKDNEHKAVDPEGDAVMAVVGGGNRDSGMFNLEMMMSRTEGDQEPPSPSPRVGGIWTAADGTADSSQPLSFNVKGTLERRQRRIHMGNKTSSFKSRFTMSGGGSAVGGGGGGGDNSVTQMAMMEDDNVSAAFTHGGGNAGLTLHSRWKSQFDDSEGEGNSENETEMKGEQLQSPEHKQTAPALSTTAAGGNEEAMASAKPAPPTPTTEKPKKLTPPKSSPPKLLIAASTSPRGGKEPVPSPKTKGSSTSPEQQQRQPHSSSRKAQQQQPSSPSVVIPPPPQLAPPPPPADFIPLQHSASAPSIPRSKAGVSLAASTTMTTTAAGSSAAPMTTTTASNAATANGGVGTAPTLGGFTPPPPPQFAPPPPPPTVALDSKATNGITTFTKASAPPQTRSPFDFTRHPLQHSTSVSSGIAASNAIRAQLNQQQMPTIGQQQPPQNSLHRPF